MYNPTQTQRLTELKSVNLGGMRIIKPEMYMNVLQNISRNRSKTSCT